MILAFYSEASGTGKDTAANYATDLLSERGYQVVRDAFAWDGKVVAADALGIDGTRLEKVAAIDEIKLAGGVHARAGKLDDVVSWVTGRDFLIGLLGSPGKGAGIRGLDESFWTRQVVERARLNEGGWTIISDMRFLEEAEAIKAAGGQVVEIIRPDNFGKFNEQRLSSSLVDHVIHNTGTLGDLRRNVNWYVNYLLGHPELATT